MRRIEEFVAQTQIGNNWDQNPLSGGVELQLFDVTYNPNGTRSFANAAGAPAQQFAIPNGQAVDFSLQVQGSIVTYTVGGKVLSSSAFEGPFTDLFLRTRSTTASSLKLSNLVLNGKSIDDLLSNSLDTINYLQISNIKGDFTLIGQSTMTYTKGNTGPKNAALAYQIKGLRSLEPPASVPEPTTVFALLLMGAAVVGSTKRKKVLN